VLSAPPKSGFSAEWLAAREPHDTAARAVELAGLLRTPELMTRTGADAHDAVARAIVDLGAGSGANLRWLLPKLGGVQVWMLIDHDPALLAAAETAIRDWASQIGAEAHAASSARGPSGGESLDDIVVTGADFACRVHRTRTDLADLERIELPERAQIPTRSMWPTTSVETPRSTYAMRRRYHASSDARRSGAISSAAPSQPFRIWRWNDAALGPMCQSLVRDATR